MTKRELIEALEALDLPDDADVFVYNEEHDMLELACRVSADSDVEGPFVRLTVY